MLGSPRTCLPPLESLEGPSGDEGSDEHLQPRSSRPMSLESWTTGSTGYSQLVFRPPSVSLDFISVSQVSSFPVCILVHEQTCISFLIPDYTHNHVCAGVTMFTQASMRIPLQMCTRYVPKCVCTHPRECASLSAAGQGLPTL